MLDLNKRYKVLSIVQDINKQTIGVYVTDGYNKYAIKTEDLIVYANKGLHFDNAILFSNGFVRAKRGTLPRETYIQDNKNIITLYHGSPNYEFTPEYGKGEDKHDYGRGFYLTPFAELAKEWATCYNVDGYLHTYTLDLNSLKIFDFDKESELCWLAELMSHRSADSSARYKRLAPLFINKFKKDITGYDVIRGWRADSSYFSIAKKFVRDEVDYTLIRDLFHLGDLQVQYCVKSKHAFSQLKEMGKAEKVDKIYAEKYTKRDLDARERLDALLNSNRNTMTLGFSYVLQEDFTI